MTTMIDRSVAQKRAATGYRARRNLRRRLATIVLATIVGLLIFLELYPLLWMFMSSFKSQFDFLNSPFWALPTTWHVENYSRAIVEGNLGQYATNSILVTAPSLVMTLLLGVAAAFTLQVMVWKGRNVVILVFLAGIMIPGQMILLPLFTMYFRAGLTGTLWPLVITYTVTGLPLTVFLIATYFRAVPKELFEAAVIDGANVFRMFWSIGMPLVRNGIVTLSILQFFFVWNDLLIAITFTNTNELQTLQVGLLSFTGQHGLVDYGPTFAAICLNVLAMLVVFAFLNRRMMSGLAAGSVKG